MNNQLLAMILKNPGQMANMSHAQLYAMRQNAPKDAQSLIGPYEHQAFAREFAQESPISAAISMPFAIPAYTAAKALGLQKTRSPASLDEIIQGYKGLAQGLFGL